MKEEWLQGLPVHVQESVRKAQSDAQEMFDNLKAVRGEPYAHAVHAGSKLAALTYMAVDLLPPEHRQALPMMAEMANDACIDIGMAIGLGADEKTTRERLVEFGKDIEVFTKASFVRK